MQRHTDNWLWALLLCCLGLCLTACAPRSSSTSSAPQQEGFQRARMLLTDAQRRTYDAFFLEAVTHVEQERLDAAYDLLVHALEINPNASEALYLQGKLLVQLTDREDSLLVKKGDSMLLRAHQLEPSNYTYCDLLAARALEQGRYARAAQLYEEMAQLRPTADIYRGLLTLYKETENHAAALRALDRYEEFEGQNWQTQYERYQLYLHAGDKAAALAQIEAIERKYPTNSNPIVLHAQYLLAEGDTLGARAQLRRAEQLNPSSDYLHQTLMDIYVARQQRDSLTALFDEQFRRPDFQAAEAHSLCRMLVASTLETPALKDYTCGMLRRACQQQPSASLCALTCSFLEENDYPEDSLYLPGLQLVGFVPEHEDVRLRMLRLALRRKDMAAVDTLCEQGFLHHVAQMVYTYFGAAAKLDLGDKAGALRVYQRGVVGAEALMAAGDSVSDLNLLSDIYAAMGDLLHDQGQPKASYAAYDKALRLNADNASALNNYAYFLSLERRDLKRALRMAERATALEPQNHYYLDTQAWLLYLLGRYEQARTQIDLSMQATIEQGEEISATLYDHAAAIYLKCRQPQAARQFWEKALPLADEAELRQRITKQLRQLGR